ncbi:MAG: tyrosine-type recombinase/integrase [Egibacteraceae bacterium]
MSAQVWKRCTKCGARAPGRRCTRCGRTKFTWAFTLDVGSDGTGKRKQQLRSGFATKAEAERALGEVSSALRHGAYVGRSNLTVGQYLLDEWLPATAPPTVKYETWADRRRTLENHVVPRVGGARLQALNASHLNRLYGELLRHGRLDGPGGLSPTTVRRVHAMLRKALNDAVRWGRLERNPAAQADPPPTRLAKAARRRTMRIWNGREVRDFLTASADHPLGVLWLVAVGTGLRRSELLGLRWSDLNLDAATATVRQTITETEQGYRPREEAKSEASARTVHLDSRTVTALKEHRAEQERIRREVGPGYRDHDLVFCQIDGSWWNPPAISLAFGRAVRRAKARPIRLHDLRHTHASLLLAAGVNPKVVSERLGHSSVAFTLDTYAHLIPGMQPRAAELFMDLVYDEPDGSADLETRHEGMPDEGPENDPGGA